MADIRLSGINKVYPGGTHAVHDVDLHIADGEFMIMVGPSGCAKSTILRMIAGLEAPTSGTIEIGGRVVNDVAPKDRDIAMVFQSYALYPHMTVRENMAFGLKLRRMPPAEIDQRVADAARILGLERLLDRLPKAMSGGQRQRVAMGRAIVREPQAFLMDEPLSNLDAKLRVQMRTEIAKLHQRLQTTTVYVTHDQVEAMTLGQRICILRLGVVQQVASPFEVYQNPANIFVGGFMGSPGMNFMHGQLLVVDGQLLLQLGERLLPLPGSVTQRLLLDGGAHGRSVVVGIRPEHLAASTSEDPSALPVQVELTEAMGSEVHAYFTANVSTPDLSSLSDTQATADTFVARLDATSDLCSGQAMWLRPDLDEVHLFDPQSMRTLLAPVTQADVRARQTGIHPPQVQLQSTFTPLEAVSSGTLADADPHRIASVFDAPVAAPVQLEPMMPAMARAQSPNHPRPTFASSITSGSSLDGPDAFPRLRRTADPAPVSVPAAVPEVPVVAPAVEAPPTPPRPRNGFAPRPIGAPIATTNSASEPPTATDMAVNDAEFDTAIAALAPIATPRSAFRSALARVRENSPKI